jgi:hypothetical protein
MQEWRDMCIYINEQIKEKRNIMKVLKMNYFKSIGFVVSLIFATMFVSCTTDDCNGYYNGDLANALVTVKPSADGKSFYMQLDDSTVLRAVNMTTPPYGTKEVRALVNFRYTDAQTDTSYKSAYVYAIDSILTKKMATNYGSDNAQKYGNDWIEIINSWTTCCEDGYLTLYFRTLWGDKTHTLNLVAENPNEPYVLTFYHNANGDNGSNYGDGLVAFRLDKLPDTEGKTVDITLKWKSQSGEKSTTFKYKTRK